MTNRQVHSSEDDAVDVGQYFRVLRDHKGLLALGLLLGLLAGLFAARMQGPSYTAVAEVVVRPIGLSDTISNLNSDGSVNIATQQQLAASAAVSDRVQESLGTDTSTSELLAGLTVTVPTRSSVLSFSYTASDAQTAQERAQGFAEAFLETRRDDGTETVNDLTARAQERVAEAETALEQTRSAIAVADADSDEAIDAQVRQDVLLSQISSLQTRLGELSTLVVEPGDVIQPATLPTSDGQLTRAAVVASFTLLGLLVGAMAAFVLSRIDKRIRRPEDVERSLDLPVLASLGGRPSRRGRSHDVPLQVLAARLLVATRGMPGRTIALASPMEGADGAGLATRLARAIAERGVRVAVVGAAVGPAGNDSDASLQVVDLARADGTLWSSSITERSCGNPERIHAILNEARATSAAVLISAPGTLCSPETLLLAAEADAVVLLAQPGVTRVDDLLDAASALEEMGSSIIGVVLDTPDRKPRPGLRPAGEDKKRSSEVAAREPADAR